MLRFTMDAKELKMMIDKGITAINKKAVIPTLTCLYFQVELDGTLKIFGTDQEHFIEIRNKNVWNTEAGIFGINIEDLKIITKINGEVTLKDISTQTSNRINILSGRKCVTIPKYDNIDIFLPDMDDTKEHILTVKESWLLETIVNLVTYTNDDKSNKMLRMIHFNTSDNRVEATNGHMLGMRTIESKGQRIEKENASILLDRKCLSVLKKVMDKKSDKEIKIYQDTKYVKLEEANFTYIIKRSNTSYLNINQLLKIDKEFSFITDKENILAIMKYNCELKGDSKNPVILHSENGNLYSYLRTNKYEVVDNIEISDNTMNNELYIGFDPCYLADVFDTVDIDKPICYGKNSNSPLFIDGNEYKFLVLPVYIVENNIKWIKEYIDRNGVA